MYNLSLENILEVRGGDDRGERRKCSFLEVWPMIGFPENRHTNSRKNPKKLLKVVKITARKTGLCCAQNGCHPKISG